VTIKFVDLRAQYNSIRGEVDAAIQGVLDRCDFINGADVAGFEEEFAALCGATHAIGLNSGTDALSIALRALGVGPGDEVITPTHTFVATAEAISAVGARPVLVDINPDTYTVDPMAVSDAVTERTKVVIPVHLYGQPADLDPILEICAERGIRVLEDACQAHGARYKGRPVGSIGDVAAYSFYPGKNLGAYGDGGALTTNDDVLAERIRLLRDHGSATKYEHLIPGFCSRLDTLQAAVLRVKLRHLDGWTAQRRRAAETYRRALSDIDGVTVPYEPGWAHSVYHLYVVRVPDRDTVQRALKAAGVESGIHYPKPIHLQRAYADLGYAPGAFPHAERTCSEILSLPMFAELTDTDIHAVADELRHVLSEIGAVQPQ
jgi:dTDP-4-amino-4,6-dideoxygalactose transaminase